MEDEPIFELDPIGTLTEEQMMKATKSLRLWTCPICGGKTSDEYISCDFCGENSIPKEIK